MAKLKIQIDIDEKTFNKFFYECGKKMQVKGSDICKLLEKRSGHIISADAAIETLRSFESSADIKVFDHENSKIDIIF